MTIFTTITATVIYTYGLDLGFSLFSITNQPKSSMAVDSFSGNESSDKTLFSFQCIFIVENIRSRSIVQIQLCILHEFSNVCICYKYHLIFFPVCEICILKVIYSLYVLIFAFLCITNLQFLITRSIQFGAIVCLCIYTQFYIVTIIIVKRNSMLFSNLFLAF